MSSRRRRNIPELLPFYNDTALWIDGADHTCFALGAGNLITATRDKSPEGNHPTQATGAKQPTFTGNGLNGKSVMTFGGAQTLLIPSPIYTLPNGNNTVYAVAQRTTESGAANFLLNLSEAAGSRHYLGYTATSGNIAFQNRTSDTSILVRGSNVNTVPNIIRGGRNGTEMAVTVNGLAETTSANGLSEAGCDSAWIGSLRDSAAYLTGFIAEIIIWRRALSPAEKAWVDTYLSKKWNIPLYI